MSSKASAFNPWPWSILGFLIFLIATIAAFVTFAIGQDMQLVTKDYYEKELRFQQDINQANNAGAFRDEISIRFQPETQSVELRVPRSLVDAGFNGTVEFYRPSNKDLDFTAPLKPRADGRQTIDVADLETGFWRLRMQWTADGKEYLFRDSVVIEPKS